ncbi:MAG: DUF975 family protein [Lachnospiraceae bacterium]|nr:DUF975 family protein [Lachnospiraceae bacterium]
MKTRNIKTKARIALTGKWSGAVLASLTYIAVTYLSNYLLLLVSGGTSTPALLSAYTISLILSLLLLLFHAGVRLYFLRLARGEEAGLISIVEAYRSQPDRFLISGFLRCLPFYAVSVPLLFSDSSSPLITAFTVICAIAGAACLLIYGLTDLLLFAHPEFGALDALRESRRLMQGNKLRLFRLYLSFIGWLLLIVLSLGIASPWIIAYFEETFCCFYESIEK